MIRVDCYAISLDGFAAGPDQRLDQPMGTGGENLHNWARETPTFQRMVSGQSTDGVEGAGVDDRFMVASFAGLGATVMGRNMFSPYRGSLTAPEWDGWWGDTPPYHHPVFVVTHHEREPLEMKGGTTFYFVNDGPEAALDRAIEAAGDLDVRVGGGAATVRALLTAGRIDRMHLAVAPTLLGRGETLLGGLDLVGLGYHCASVEAGEGATHYVVERQAVCT